MTTNMIRLSKSQSGPFLIHDLLPGLRITFDIYVFIAKKVPLVDQELLTHPEPLEFLVVFVSVVFCVVVSRSLFDLFSLFIWSLYYCLPFFYLRLFITPLVSSKFSFNEPLWHKNFKIYQPTNEQMEQNITMLNPKWRNGKVKR